MALAAVLLEAEIETLRVRRLSRLPNMLSDLRGVRLSRWA